MLEKKRETYNYLRAYGKTKNREVWRNIIRTSSSAS